MLLTARSKAEATKIFAQFFDEVTNECLTFVPEELRGRAVAIFKQKLDIVEKNILEARSIAVGSIKKKETIYGYLNLVPVRKIWRPRTMANFRSEPIPEDLITSLKKFDFVHRVSKSLEPKARSRFDLILTDVLFVEVEELRFASDEKKPSDEDGMNVDDEEEDDETDYDDSDDEDEIEEDFEIPDAFGDNCVVFQRTENNLAYPISLEGKPVILNGRADYTVCYDDKEHEMATNLIVMETKQRGSTKQGLIQTIGYMGIVHRLRKDLDEGKTEIYGIATDGLVFYFLKVEERGEKSMLYQSKRYVWGVKSGARMIYSIIRSIIRHSRTLSPLSTRQPTDNV